MIKRYLFNALLVFILLFSVTCKKDAPLLISDLTGIDVNPDKTLVGIVTDSKSGKPLKGIVVSDGFTSIKTDDKGVYQIKKNGNSRFVYYSIPEEYEVNTQDGLPMFYEEIPDNYKIFRKDFKLTKMKDGVEKNFTLFSIADPQVASESDMLRFQTETVPDINESVKEHGVSYGLLLGDLVFDTPNLMNPLKNIFAEANVKLFPVIGNHDHNEKVHNDFQASRNYENVFGPTNYSFNRGDVHIVVMDNVIYSGRQNYKGDFTKEQIAWLKNDLEFVPKSKIVIIAVHIPIRSEANMTYAKDIYDLIEPYKEAHIMSGHAHYNQNIKVPNSKIYEHIHGAACGAFWTATINRDATPNGYGVYEITGNTIKNWYYKSTSYSKDFQLRMYPAGSYGDPFPGIVANVWNVDEDWKVELYEDNVKSGDMIWEMDYDKAAFQFFSYAGRAKPDKTKNETTTWFVRTGHLFRFTPNSTKSKISIKATDRFGNVYVQDQFTVNTASFGKYK